MAEYVRDEFARDVASTWGTATIGGAWTESLAAGSASSVSTAAGGMARLNITGTTIGPTQQRLAAATPARDVAMACMFRVTALVSSNILRAMVRVSGAIGAPVSYWAQVTVQADGAMIVSLGRSDAGGASVITSSIATAAGTYVPNAWWRLELQAVGTPTTLRARIWSTTGAVPDQADGWVTITGDTSGPQVAGFYQFRTERTAPGVSTNVLTDLGDVYVTDPPVAAFTWTGTADPRAFDFTGATSTGDVAAYSWYWGHGGSTSAGVTSSHTFPSRGMFRVRLRVTTRWAAWYQRGELVVVDYPEAGTDPGQIDGPLLPSILIDGVNVCSKAFGVSWSLGRTGWSEQFGGQTCSIRLRGRYAADVGHTVTLSAPVDPDGTPLWAGIVDQVSMTLNPIEGDDETMIVAMDVASYLGRWHLEKGTSLPETKLPSRLAGLDPVPFARFRAKWSGVPSSRWPDLKKKDWKPDTLRDRTFLDMINDALAGSIAFAYVARNGDMVYAPWEPPAGTAATPVITLDSGIDCAALVLLEQDSPNGIVNRWTVGDGDNVDRMRRSSIADYGEHSFSVATGILTTESTFPITDARIDAMSDPADALTAEVPVSRIDQRAVITEPLDFARFEGVLYTVLGIRHEVSITGGWRATLTLDRDAWATAGQSPPAATSKPGEERPEVQPLEVAA